MWSSKRQRRSSRKKKLILAFFLVVIGILAFYYSSYVDDSKYDELIEKSGRRHNVDGRLIKALIYQESKFYAGARGADGEIGLMQIMPRGAVVDWARHYKFEVPREGLLFAPVLNIEIGTWHLSKALQRWRNYKYAEELALCQYNAGGKRANLWKPENYGAPVIERIKIRSTRAYVTAIMRRYKKYCENSR